MSHPQDLTITLNGHQQIPDVIAGVTFTDGVKQQAA